MHQDDRSSASSFFSTALLTGLPPCVHPPTSQNPLPGREREIERERRVLERRSRTHRAWMDDRMVVDRGCAELFQGWMNGRRVRGSMHGWMTIRGGSVEGRSALHTARCTVSLTRVHGLRRRRDRPQSSSNWNRIPFGPLLGVDSDALPAKIRPRTGRI